MKYLATILLFFITTITFAKPKVVCTTTIIYDIAQNIAQDKVQLICLMPVGGDPHIYEPVPGDAQKVADADMILKNGLFLEGWLEKLINNKPSNTIYAAANGIEAIQNKNLHASPDPHAWMDAKLGMIYAANIKNALVATNPANANFYEQNFQTYLQKLIALDQYIADKINSIPEKKRVLITSHDAFRYFGRHYGIRVEAALGTSTDAEAQIGDINNLIKIIKETSIGAIFIEATINPKLIYQLATDQGIKIGGKLYADSVGDPKSGAGTYIDMLRYNADTIANGLIGTGDDKIVVDVQVIALISSALFLFIWAFVWIYLKIKPNNHTKMDWHQYSIEVKNLSVSYEKKTVLTNINFTLQSGKLYGLLGPNGAGKSTLFKSILGLITPDSGEVIINGQKVSDIRNKIAYIPQKEEIDWTFPATVFDIVLTGRLPEKSQFELYSTIDKKKTTEAIQKMGLSEFANRQISDLSGGQQQRVFIARALCQEAEVLFFDEPFVGVDITTEEKIIAIIKKLVEERKTVIMIHHDLSKVKEYFDQIIMVNQRLIACGSTSALFTNENIAKTYGGRLAILQETDKYVF